MQTPEQLVDRISSVQDPNEQYNLLLGEAALFIADVLVESGEEALYSDEVTMFVAQLMRLCSIRYNKHPSQVDKDFAHAIDNVDDESIKQAKWLRAQGRLN